MALLFYRNIYFVAPQFLSEDEFNTLKRIGVSNNSDLPSLLKFHFYNSIFVAIGLLAYYLNKVLPSFSTLEFIWAIIFIFWLPKILIETYKYVKYMVKEKSFKKKLNDILNNTTSYSEFRYQYDQKFIKSKFGKWLIKKYIN